ncbi:hypothetical protein RND81_06G151200 [Saponaria officinalis]|uniref:Uncharacterized protein n=1 Tax=Saponaria officinalis TaxID=3572 RepID=A0AAW1KC22_SAPOF
MESLQRSVTSFRRQGSSGLIWNDNNKIFLTEQKKSDESGPSDQNHGFQRAKSDGGARRTYRIIKVVDAEDPPSPRLSGCGFFSVFNNNNNNNKNNKKNIFLYKNNKSKNGKSMHK